MARRQGGQAKLIRPLLFIAAFVIWIWALVDCIRVSDDSMFRAGNKLMWIIVILVGHFIGAILYFILGRPARERRL